MIIKLEDLSHGELVETNKRAIVQITRLVEEKQKLEKQISKLVDENKSLRAIVRKSIETDEEQEGCPDDRWVHIQTARTGLGRA